MDKTIAELKEAFAASKPFYDDRHFPRGFSRSGHFTLLESELLQQHGHLLRSLQKQELKPINPLQQQFLNTFSQQTPPTNRIEKVWSKYLELTTKKHKVHTLSVQNYTHRTQSNTEQPEVEPSLD
ncbi:DUF413 domain-containing protein [Pseudoalteromonas luteoviolacea]|uniref:Macrodomain Ori protein n=1 Tax=Pseudoalteromonas luteoviolacea S4054 TaxID=1129367 RepID=A0A0F6A5Y0_9GAMM|nr:DUF413 domain-containing protein [Pseudoalteromonas luteoviolacea]AOT07132.1 hypothetical protein S4054249_04300 [Pseudoalteromonas luteoviolacea]AOT12049.1 hypothetical protein S40542_04300 [Pseudoalteromonas luteoviolacea]AOT16962.1 hypothetical protein S4054_04300 [Pseudoalteromonas luteoviolacea]KKE81518.1 hypothetical protein N479_22205 [Pseudoalteromonas luteoviolacea S4054]KZN70040.1 hypothetical protein N481_21745 [Pseudoalteromonas luteoviolacea S4047-1]